jgi:hypothetical protein
MEQERKTIETIVLKLLLDALKLAGIGLSVELITTELYPD